MIEFKDIDGHGVFLIDGKYASEGDVRDVMREAQIALDAHSYAKHLKRARECTDGTWDPTCWMNIGMAARIALDAGKPGFVFEGTVVPILPGDSKQDVVDRWAAQQ